jgi:ABC transport system ATP-binding/permease protein
MYKLTIEDDEGKTVVVPLIRDEITVGRQEGNSIRLTERNISRRHARLFRQNGETLFIEDVGSYNGVMVNGSRISAATPLKENDLVIVGDYKLIISSDRRTEPIHYGAGTPFAAPVAARPRVITAPPQPTAAPAPQATLEGSPTIPVRTLAEQGLAPAAPLASSAPPARLVITSTSLAGSEFLLDRPSLVIGRTPENDIVLDHRSISRHHAKVLRDGDRYIVVDLESANGVRVNGVEFERVEIQSGDVLELGHVRLRLVDGNEQFDFAASRRRGKVFAALATVGAVAVGAAVFATVSPQKQTPAPVEAPNPATAAAPSLPVAPADPSPVAEAEAAHPFLTAAKEAVASEDWSAASASVGRALQLAPALAEAITLRQSIEEERTNAEHFAALKRAAEMKNHEAVLDAFAAISENSVYKGRALPLQQEASALAASEHLAEAERLHSRGRCEEAQLAAERVLELDPDSAGAHTVIDRCERLAARLAARKEAQPVRDVARRPARNAASARSAAPRTTAEPAQAPAAAASPPSVAAAERTGERLRPASSTGAQESTGGPAGGDPDALIQEARQAYLRGQYAAAIEAAQKALRLRPNLMAANQIIAVSSCSLRDKDSATRAYEKLDSQNKQLVKSHCQKHGIALD